MSKSVKLLANSIIAPAYLAYTVGEGAYAAFKWAAGRKKTSQPEQAAFASNAELKRAGHFQPRGFMPGVTEKGRRVHFDDETSVVSFGIRGAGKTQTMIANLKALDEKRPDLIISDPAGDIETSVSQHLQTLGYGFVRLDLSNPRSSHRYNPLSFLKPSASFDFGRDVMSLCSLLIPEGARMDDTGTHFLESARAMLQSMMMYRVAKGELKFSELIIRLIVEKKLRTKDFETMQASVSHPLIKQGIEAFLAAGDRERGAMDSTLSRKLRPLLDDSVRYITQGQEWSFEEMFLQPKPIAVFIRSGLGNEEFGGAFTRIVVGNAINTVRRMWNTQISAGIDPRKAALPKGLWIMVDEARAMGNCPAVIHAVNELRKAGVNVFLCFHTLADVKETYSSPQALLNGCAWVVSGGSRDIELYERLSKLSGERTVTSKSWSYGDKKSESEHESSRPFVTIDSVEKLPKDEVIVKGPGMLAKLKKPFAITKDGVRYL